jgi:hypothetical protein
MGLTVGIVNLSLQMAVLGVSATHAPVELRDLLLSLHQLALDAQVVSLSYQLLKPLTGKGSGRLCIPLLGLRGTFPGGLINALPRAVV